MVTRTRTRKIVFHGLLMMVLWLPIGCVGNVIATWTIAQTHTFPSDRFFQSSASSIPIPKSLDDRWLNPVWRTKHLAWNGEEDQFEPASGNSTDYYWYLRVRRFGFPCRSFAFRGVSFVSFGLNAAPWEYAYDVVIPRLGTARLPLYPLWPGFALNTLFYAALAWGVWQLPLAIRRRRRSRKGLCVRCGYDLQGLPSDVACPECGSVPRVRV